MGFENWRRFGVKRGSLSAQVCSLLEFCFGSSVKIVRRKNVFMKSPEAATKGVLCKKVFLEIS